MNGESNDWRLADETLDRTLDCLVDGELSSHQRRSLLAALDEQPGGWRRCALAFLEAQEWGRELSQAPDHADPSGAERSAAAARQFGKPRWPLALAVAASFLVAFGLGWGAADWRSFDARSGAIVDTAPADSQSNLNTARQGGGGDENQPPNVALAAAGDVGDAAFLTLAVGAGPDAEVIDLPVYELEEVGAQWLIEQSEPLPAELVQTIERSGHQVQRQQRLMPIGLENGASVVVPVERIQITPVALQAFQ